MKYLVVLLCLVCLIGCKEEKHIKFSDTHYISDTTDHTRERVYAQKYMCENGHITEGFDYAIYGKTFKTCPVCLWGWCEKHLRKVKEVKQWKR